LTEQWAFVHFIKAKKRLINKELDLAFVKEIKRDLILAHISISDFGSSEKYLWQGVSAQHRSNCETIFRNVPPMALRPSNALKIIAISVVGAEYSVPKNTTNDSITSICALVSNKDLLRVLGSKLGSVCESLAAVPDWDLPVDMTLGELLRVHETEDRKRVQFALGELNEIGERTSDPFDGSPFSVPMLKKLTKVGSQYGIE